jgi:hypothetical protein
MVLALAAILAFGTAGAAPAQMRTVDPNQASDLAPVPSSEANYGTKVTAPAATPAAQPVPAAPAAPAGTPPTTAQAAAEPEVQEVGQAPVGVSARGQAEAAASNNNVYEAKDMLSAAEGVFGTGAAGLAKLIEKIFKEQGKPNAYIAGREASGAFVVGLRYGSGTMFHKVEGKMPVYWTGPSIGFDVGANGAKTFVLVYNLFDSADLYHRFPEVEGTAYIIGGFTATFLRRGDVVLIPIRLGLGWRLGINAGYMKFSKTSKAFPL